MLIFLRRFCLAAIALSATCSTAYAATANPVLLNKLSHAAPELNPQALKSALSAMQCAVNNGAKQARHLAVIDYSEPSTARRLWIFDLNRKTLVLRDLVAHGKKSGKILPPASPTPMAATSPAWACSAPAKAISAATATRCAWTAWNRGSTIWPANGPS